VIQLRIVAPSHVAEAALRVLEDTPSATNLVHVPGAARRPAGDLVLADVPREEASVVLGRLRDSGVDRTGSIAIDPVSAELSRTADAAERRAGGAPGDAVVWEELEAVTSESTELTVTFIAFMLLASVIAAVGILLDSEILVVGAMVVGPEFGPLAGLCVALVQRRGVLAGRSLLALAIGFPPAILLALVMTRLFRFAGIGPQELAEAELSVSQFIADPNWFTVVVALAAGAAGMLSLTSSKSSALVGVLISVTTLPAAANAGVAAAYGDWGTVGGSLAQLGLNLFLLVLAGTTTLAVQRRAFSRRLRHEAAG
jgi:uncharacterized hydrophobic protein (TIGR00271 family)